MSPRTHSNDLQTRVASVLKAAGVRSTPVVVGVSGGADSLALLVLLTELRGELALDLTAAHLDHALRPDSADDAAFVAECCRNWSVPLVTERLSVAVSESIASEDAARDARRDFFSRTCGAVRAAWVALAHTANDQAETVLHRLLRGTGPRGLRGMSTQAPLNHQAQIVRPLLDVSRDELERWLVARGQGWRTDATNTDSRFTRNRIRHTLLPLLREQFNPQVDSALVRLAKQCRELDDWLREAAAAALAEAQLERHADRVRLATERLVTRPRQIVREVFVLLWRQQGWPEQRMTFDHWNLLADVVIRPGPQRTQVPGGIDVTRDGTILRLERRLEE
jgi:tRNA(Ile)-lysidine synthase